jgi:hypothetical protein
MAHPQVAGGGDTLQICRAAANMLNKQLQTADKGWSTSLEVGRGSSNLSPLKNKLVTKCHIGLGLGRVLFKLPKLRKMDLRFGM